MTDRKKIKQGAIVVVAKCPIRGKSKTRLIPLLGEDGSSSLAKAMLSDVLMTLDYCPALREVQKVLLYAPGNDEGLTLMQGILEELGIETYNPGRWKLLPMVSPDLKSSDLGQILQLALERVVQSKLNNDGGVVFLGMDSPVLPLTDIVTGLNLALKNQGILCPADDGGYGMLCIPEIACSQYVFQNVYWSHSLTAVSQLKSLTDKSIHVSLGQLMYDIDEPEDVERLCKRLSEKSLTGAKTENSTSMGLETSSQQQGDTRSITSDHTECHFTRQALVELELLKKPESR